MKFSTKFKFSSVNGGSFVKVAIVNIDEWNYHGFTRFYSFIKAGHFYSSIVGYAVLFIILASVAHIKEF